MRILVVRRDNIGDLVCTTPLLAGLRAAHPDAWIGVLVNTYNAEVLSRNPAVDAVFAYEKLKHRQTSLFRFVLDRARLARGLRHPRLDWALVPAASPQSVDYARKLAPRNLAIGNSDDTRHEVVRTWVVGASLGLRGDPGPLCVVPDPARVSALEAMLATRRQGAAHPQRPRVAIHLSARRPRQRWPEERYAALIRRVAVAAEVLLLWAPGPASDARHPGDDEKAARVLDAAHGAGVVPLPTPDLATLIAALALCDRVICPDGGAMHLGAALGKPVVALFGDSPVERWRPWGVPHRVVRPESGDLADLSVDAVLAAHAELARITDHEHRA